MLQTPGMGLTSIGKNDSPSQRTIRFSVELEQTTETDFPEFSYAKLLEKARKRTRTSLSPSNIIGDVELPAKSDGKTKTEPESGEMEDDVNRDERREIEQIAAKMEAKYGTSVAGNRRVHDEDYVDVGSGYDETDPFVDNTEAHDDFVPFHLEPQYGGFYVNSGELYFTEQSKDESVLENEKQPLNGKDEEDDDFQRKRSAPRLFKLKPPKSRKTKEGKFEPRKRKKGLLSTAAEAKMLPAKTRKIMKVKPAVSTHVVKATQSPVQPTVPVSKGDGAATVVKEDWPADFPSELQNQIEEWKQEVIKDNSMNKPAKQFQSCYNSRLLKVGRLTFALRPKRYQTRVYEYLSSFLPATKGTLMKRLKDLLSIEHRELMKGPFEQLKKVIDDAMSSQILKYEEKKKSMNDSEMKFIEDDLSDGEAETEPLKRFCWTDDVKSCLFDLVGAKLRAIREINRHLIDPPSQIRSFLKEEVKVLWPQGWMNSNILYEVSMKAHESFTQLKVKKKKEILSPKTNPTSKVLASPNLSIPSSVAIPLPVGSILSQHSYSLPASSVSLSQPMPALKRILPPFSQPSPSSASGSSSSQPALPTAFSSSFAVQAPHPPTNIAARLLTPPLPQQQRQVQGQSAVSHLNMPSVFLLQTAPGDQPHASSQAGVLSLSKPDPDV